jgi:sugar lactone lactonase YvrE
MKYIFLIFSLFAVISCGRRPADLLRQGQAPVYDFPLYVSSGDGTGTIWKFERDGSKSMFVTGLSDPRGIALDRYGNMYVAEYAAQRVIKINLSNQEITVVADQLQTPSVVAVDSFGDVFVNQEGAKNIIRARDKKIIQTYDARPTALAFGVNDLMVVGLFDTNKVIWGPDLTSPSDSIQEPVMIATDATGRTYVAEGTVSNARVYRYQQTSPAGKTVVADSLSGATGIAVDAVGNIYIAEPGASRISLVTFKNEFFYFANVIAPLYIAFTQY